MKQFLLKTNNLKLNSRAAIFAIYAQNQNKILGIR